MESVGDGPGPLPAREADARLGARVRRMSLLWWAAASVVLCLLNFTTDPLKAWLADPVGYAGGGLAGLGWSLLVAHWLIRERRRIRREAVWAGLGLAVLGGFVGGAVAGVLNLCAASYWKLEAPVAAQFAAFVGVYIELCVGWCFIYLVVAGAERLLRVEEEVAALRVVAYDSQSALIRSEFRFDFVRTVFSELDEFLALRKQPESQEVVVAVAAKLRGALDRWLDAAGRGGDGLEANAAELQLDEAEFNAPDVFTKVVMNLRVANAIFWGVTFALMIVTMGPFYLMLGGVRYCLWYFGSWLAFCLMGYLACVVLEQASAFIAAQIGWKKCALAGVFYASASSVSALAPWAVWNLYSWGGDGVNTAMVSVYYYGCVYAVWYCLYFYAQALRREVTQRARLAQAAEAAAAARNSMLRYQVRPHFLFNALNALYALIADRSWAAARAMTQALSQYVERAFAEDERALVPIGEQVEALQAYLGIEKIRFGERLRFHAEIPERLADACAPSLILHPLVENAMKYAVAATADPVDVEIAADLIGDTLRLRVCDSGGDPQASAAPGLGIGLSNVAARLAGHYGDRGFLQCKRLTPKGFIAEIRLPLEFACTRFAA